MFFTGDESADIQFELAEWVSIQEDLACSEALFSMLSRTLKGKCSGNHKGWPMRGLMVARHPMPLRFDVTLDEARNTSTDRRYKFGFSSLQGHFWSRGKEEYTSIESLTPTQVRDVDFMCALFERHIGSL